MEDPDCYNRRSESKKQKYGTKLHLRRDFPVPMKKLMCYYICMKSMCPNDYVLYYCSARSNLQTQYSVDTMLVHTSGLAEVTTKAGNSSRNL